MNPKISCMLWNARSIRDKQHDFFDYLVYKNIDICILTETWLEAKDKFRHPLYNIFRCDRSNRRGGGVAIVAHKSLNVRHINSTNTKSVENVIIELMINNTELIKVIGVYFPGGRSNNALRSEYKNDLRKLLKVGGDLFYMW